MTSKTKQTHGILKPRKPNAWAIQWPLAQGGGKPGSQHKLPWNPKLPLLPNSQGVTVGYLTILPQKHFTVRSKGQENRLHKYSWYRTEAIYFLVSLLLWDKKLNFNLRNSNCQFLEVWNYNTYQKCHYLKWSRPQDSQRSTTICFLMPSSGKLQTNKMHWF